MKLDHPPGSQWLHDAKSEINWQLFSVELAGILDRHTTGGMKL